MLQHRSGWRDGIRAQRAAHHPARLQTLVIRDFRASGASMTAEELQAAVEAAQNAATLQGDRVRALKADLKEGKVDRVSFDSPHLAGRSIKPAVRPSSRFSRFGRASCLLAVPGPSRSRGAGPRGRLPASLRVCTGRGRMGPLGTPPGRCDPARGTTSPRPSSRDGPWLGAAVFRHDGRHFAYDICRISEALSASQRAGGPPLVQRGGAAFSGPLRRPPWTRRSLS